MSDDLSTVLVIGYGNPGRRDDGLGPAFAAALEAHSYPGVTVDADYQLTVEDAATVAQHDAAVFVDADTQGAEPFCFRRLAPGDAVTFSTHSVSAEGVLALAQELFHAKTSAYVLGVRGYEFNEFGEGLSEQARENLAAALAFFEPIVCQRTFSEWAAPSAGAPAAAPANGDMQCKTENT